MTIMYIMQGAPGSGKSYYAKFLKSKLPNAVICSTDDFHTSDGEDYCFQQDNLSWFHAWNQYHAELCLKEGKNVIVDNCNVRQIHAQPYINMARKYYADIQINCFTRIGPNQHGVPAAIVERMRAEMETLHTFPTGESNAYSTTIRIGSQRCV